MTIGIMVLPYGSAYLKIKPSGATIGELVNSGHNTEMQFSRTRISKTNGEHSNKIPLRSFFYIWGNIPTGAKMFEDNST